jgi:hypothetical protein
VADWLPYWKFGRFMEASMSEDSQVSTSTLSETANYQIWQADEPDGETTFHIEFGNATLHFFADEWQEFLELIRGLE